MRKHTKEQKRAARADYWRELIAEQKRSGVSIQRFCEDRGLTEQSFYAWRKRLKKDAPMQFALVQAGSTADAGGTDATLELVLRTGERLRIGTGVNVAALRLVLEALRA
jgi:transposase-like protein